MFSDTLAITVNGVTKTLVRVNQDRYSSEYRLRETAGEYALVIRNTKFVDKTRSNAAATTNKVEVNRHNVEFIHTLYPTNAGIMPIVRKVYMVFQNDNSDDVVAPVKHALGLAGFITEANLTKLINFES